MMPQELKNSSGSIPHIMCLNPVVVCPAEFARTEGAALTSARPGRAVGQ